MKNVNKILTKLLIIYIIFMMICSMYFNYISLAVEIKVVTEDNEKEKLLGTTSSKARTQSILGLANEFSIFSNGPVTAYSSDIEGRLAANGNVNFKGVGNYNWKYQVGCGYNNYDINTTGAAEVIVNGKIINLNVNEGATIDGINYSANKTVVVQNLSDEDPENEIMSWGYDEDEIDKFISADLIDFNEEFKWLKQQSQKLIDVSGQGGIIEQKSMTYSTNIGNPSNTKESTQKVIVLTGTKKNCNLFNFTVDEFNEIFGSGYAESDKLDSDDVIFNVPEGSSIIINITGTGTVNFRGSYNNTSLVYRRILVPYSKEDIKKDSSLENKFSMYLYDESKNDFIKDSNGDYLLFVDIANENNVTRANNILYNVLEATDFTIKDNFLGSILAPNAKGTNPTDKPMKDGCAGHLSGNLVCASYEGTMQFGFLPCKMVTPVLEEESEPLPEPDIKEEPKEETKEETKEEPKLEEETKEEVVDNLPTGPLPQTGDKLLTYLIVLVGGIIIFIIIMKKKNYYDSI